MNKKHYSVYFYRSGERTGRPRLVQRLVSRNPYWHMLLRGRKRKRTTMDELTRAHLSLPPSSSPCSTLANGLRPALKDGYLSDHSVHVNHLGILLKMQILVQ